MAPKASSQVLTEESQTQRKDFYWTNRDEPHYERHKKILRDHPEVKELMGHDPSAKYTVITMVLIQLIAAYFMRNTDSWIELIIVAYGLGGTINGALAISLHESTHNLFFGNGFRDRLFSILVSNLPLGLPAAITFRRYHLDHHVYQGVQGYDPDLPIVMEGRFAQGVFRKAMWMFLQGLAYAFRPVLVRPKSMSSWEVINWSVQIIFDVAVIYFWGWQAMIYFILSSFLGMGIHPLAGHFISEHYISNPVQETYSYYGPMNWFTFNVGYHVEHHDFQNIPGSRLPELKKMAPEYYDHLAYYDSWTKVLWWYITDCSVSPFSRAVRTKEDRDKALKEIKETLKKKQQTSH
eukprot:gb/GECH01012059.1/.p1 GENE.gb/GECH01012059.1/~~gb/GECH01012059.1/.p1  ORF type:complete len:350 (+),score=64.91 gb/GECH01012059.1/:1-1050(+)